ncbi:hypothetical protein BCR34DRAFT_606422 [Clohesyomyces aquaticus]|uniref:ATP-grasp domain-containing protein n=1 Tax=Clohesyomyces aquaticus TaxID=1231657 RepID=A0A1Y1YR39_9PLEO|nr:hypothetical protein BCR34DRAFT_606422 [Clohesyomyces aquaticus]
MSSAPKQSNSTPFFYHHLPKNLLLILLSFICLPVTATLVLLSLYSSRTTPNAPKREQKQDQDAKQNAKARDQVPITILVTGVSMTKGLSIARLLSQYTPHLILGADVEHIPNTSPGRYSRSLTAFFPLTPPDANSAEPYIESLAHLIRATNVDLWISCSSVVSAVEDGEVVRRVEKGIRERNWDGRIFKAVQFSEDVVQELHSKDRFLEFVRGIGEVVPETHRCESPDAVVRILKKERKGTVGNTDAKKNGRRKDEKKDMRYILKPIGVDDRARGNMMTLLPLPTVKETTEYISTLSIGKSNPYILQQYISGPEYCTHALVIRGVVQAFVACPSSDLLMHYEALDPSAPLTQDMLRFTEKVAKEKGENFTGHLSFDFLAEGDREGEKSELFPIECNPRAHTAVVLFQDEPRMAQRYLDIFSASSERPHAKQDVLVPEMQCPRYYWAGHDLVALVIIPVLDLLWGQASVADVKKGGWEFWTHLRDWRDGTFEAWDPVPFLVLYHVYWPMKFLESVLNGKQWSRTTKIFEC